MYVGTTVNNFSCEFCISRKNVPPLGRAGLRTLIQGLQGTRNYA